jgi:hypothetical protein
MNPNPAPQRIKPWRPVILIALVILLLIFSVLCWMRFGLAIGNDGFYNQVSGQPLSLYFIVTGAVWGLTSLAAALGDWFRKPWALILTGVGAVTFSIWFWAERVLLSRTPYARTNWLFDAIFNLILLIFIGSTVVAVYPYQPRENPKGKSHA